VKSPVAVVTMVYNEPDFLPVWAAHYRAAVGAEHCYVIDHGSDDASIDASGQFNLVQLKRSPLDEVWARCGVPLSSHTCAPACSIGMMPLPTPMLMSCWSPIGAASTTWLI
jgi:hypothetical protein